MNDHRVDFIHAVFLLPVESHLPRIGPFRRPALLLRIGRCCCCLCDPTRDRIGASIARRKPVAPGRPTDDKWRERRFVLFYGRLVARRDVTAALAAGDVMLSLHQRYQHIAPPFKGGQRWLERWRLRHSRHRCRYSPDQRCHPPVPSGSLSSRSNNLLYLIHIFILILVSLQKKNPSSYSILYVSK